MRTSRQGERETWERGRRRGVEGRRERKHSKYMCVFCREKMPFHHVRSTLLYTGSLLSRTLSEGSEAFQITSISTEELGGQFVCVCVSVRTCATVLVCIKWSVLQMS